MIAGTQPPRTLNAFTPAVMGFLASLQQQTQPIAQ